MANHVQNELSQSQTLGFALKSLHPNTIINCMWGNWKTLFPYICCHFSVLLTEDSIISNATLKSLGDLVIQQVF